MKKWLKWTGIGLAALVLIGGAGFVLWANDTNPVGGSAQTALVSDEGVTVTQDEWIIFRPAGGEPETGLIFYPGGRVEPAAYAPLMHSVAESGRLAVIVPMPLNLAVLDADAAGVVAAAYPAVQTWAVGGHSLGGSMAANYVYNNPGSVAGLVLLASYPAASNDLSGWDGEVVSIYGTRDGLATVDDVTGSAGLLPSDMTFVAIEGGNHAQFGAYGDQKGDNPAAISREDQQEQTLEAILALLEAIEQ